MAKETKRVAKTKSTETEGPTTKSPSRGTAAPRKTKSPIVLDERMVRERAYQIYLRRRGGPGDALSDWKQAERELLAELS